MNVMLSNAVASSVCLFCLYDISFVCLYHGHACQTCHLNLFSCIAAGANTRFFWQRVQGQFKLREVNIHFFLLIINFHPMFHDGLPLRLLHTLGPQTVRPISACRARRPHTDHGANGTSFLLQWLLWDCYSRIINVTTTQANRFIHVDSITALSSINHTCKYKQSTISANKNTCSGSKTFFSKTGLLKSESRQLSDQKWRGQEDDRALPHSHWVDLTEAS